MNANAAPPSGEPTGIPGFAAPEFHPCDLAQYREIVGTLSWPEQTGGMQTLRRILEVCDGPEFVAERERRNKRFHELTDEKRVRLSEPEERQLSQELRQLLRSLTRDDDLVRLLEPEKRRLHQEMGKAIRRVLDLLFA